MAKALMGNMLCFFLLGRSTSLSCLEVNIKSSSSCLAYLSIKKKIEYKYNTYTQLPVYYNPQDTGIQ